MLLHENTKKYDQISDTDSMDDKNNFFMNSPFHPVSSAHLCNNAAA